MKITKPRKTKSLSLYIELTSTKSTGKRPDVSLRLNDRQLSVTESGLYQLEYVGEPDLEIGLHNKSPDDTVITDGKITDDLLVVVRDIKIDGIDFSEQLNYVLDYRDSNGESHKTHGHMHRNGTIRLKIIENVLYTKWLTTFIK